MTFFARTGRVALAAALVLTATGRRSAFSQNTDPAGAPLAVEVRSFQPGNLFTERQKLDFVAIVIGANRAPDSVVYQVREHGGGRLLVEGTVTKPAGSRVPLRLSLPGRGLYDLSVTARTGTQTATTNTRLGVVFDPGPPDPGSRWGVFTIPYDGPHDPQKARALARSQRLLGARWSRLNFWHFAYEDVAVTGSGDDARVVSVRFAKWKGLAEALKVEGVAVMGEFSEMPRTLSSRSEDTAESSEGSAGWARVKPRDWRLWEDLVEQTVRAFRNEITYWEVWNEPDGNNFWLGTPDEFAQLIQHTAAAAKRGNPDVWIVASGFTGSTGAPFLDRVLAAGAGKSIDVFSFHADDLAPFKAVLAKHGISPKTPIWATEAHELVDLNGMAAGYQRQFHFFHQLFGASYGAFAALVDRDLTPLPDGMTYSVAAHVVGAATVTKAINTDTAQIYTFRKGKEAVAVWKTRQRGLMDGSVTLALTPPAGSRLELLDAFGRAAPLKNKGAITLPLRAGTAFVRGAADIRIVGYTLPREKPDPEQYVFPAVSGTWTPGWERREPGKQNPPPASDLTVPFLTIYQKEPPGARGYAVEVPLTVPRAGRYEVYYLGLTTYALVPENRWTSPFAWSVDGGPKTEITAPLPSLRRANGEKWTKNDPVAPGDRKFTGGPDVYQRLGTIELTPGPHTFRLELTQGRRVPDTAYTTFFEGVVLRPAGQTP